MKLSSYLRQYQKSKKLEYTYDSLSEYLIFLDHCKISKEDQKYISILKDIKVRENIIGILSQLKEDKDSVEVCGNSYIRFICYSIAKLYSIWTEKIVENEIRYFSCKDYECICGEYCCGCCAIPDKIHKKYCIGNNYDDTERKFRVPHSRKIGVKFILKK